MADSSNTTRRQFLKAAPAVLAPAAGLAAFMAEAATPDEQVLHHIREIERILAETRPMAWKSPRLSLSSMAKWAVTPIPRATRAAMRARCTNPTGAAGR
ncbi:MAG: twin-arginine translocation signal domain-containing protein [Myxococcales bacterium]|nr:twin-arginine translocation signal domain-containing protein [Myxococcales bacterium]